MPNGRVIQTIVAISLALIAGFLMFRSPSDLQDPSDRSNPTDQTDQPTTTGSDPKPSTQDSPTAEHAILELPAELKTPEDVLALVAEQSLTHRAIQDGHWNDPATWGGQIPLPGARVHIASGITVTLGDEGTAHLKSLLIDGSVVLAPQEDTKLHVDNLIVNREGSLRAGSVEDPLPVDREALVSIEAYNHPNDTAEMRRHSAQMISMGEVSLHGQPKSGMGLLAQAPLAGDREIILDQAPTNWKIGDLITIGGNRVNREELEQLQIAYVKDNRVGLARVQTGDEPWQGLPEDLDTRRDLRNFAVNMSRNVGISSPPPGEIPDSPPASLIFQGQGVGEASLSNVGIYGLGGTDRLLVGQDDSISRPAIAFHQSDNMTTAQQSLAPVLATGANARPTLDPYCLTPGGTVGLPANRVGHHATGPAAQITGMAIVDAPEDGISINNSAVNIRGGVSYSEHGGGWLTPNGSPSLLVWSAKRTVPRIP
ncbi:MAG: G8 domain-containing protein [Limisphaerales bacterium]